MKPTTTELVRAAQVAGAAQQPQEFWHEVESYLAQKTHERSQLVQPRPLTVTPKAHTI